MFQLKKIQIFDVSSIEYFENSIAEIQLYLSTRISIPVDKFQFPLFQFYELLQF